jgi:hypothetical protein
MMVAKKITQMASLNLERYGGKLRTIEVIRDYLFYVDHGKIRDASGTPMVRPRRSVHFVPSDLSQRPEKVQTSFRS